MIDADDYCRQIEAYLCRKNDGHLIRIVGPAFEQVAGWASEGIPLSVACVGVDRYFERYYRKGPRRRPVRIEFCDADVRDAFDDWRRAVGVARAAESGGEESGRGRRTSLASHIERAVDRLTVLRGSTQPGASLAGALDTIVRQLDGMRAMARTARGETRAALALELEMLDRQLVDRAVESLPATQRGRLEAEADEELAPFRGRMLAESFAKAKIAAFERLVRETFALPLLRYEP